MAVTKDVKSELVKKSQEELNNLKLKFNDFNCLVKVE